MILIIVFFFIAVFITNNKLNTFIFFFLNDTQNTHLSYIIYEYTIII